MQVPKLKAKKAALQAKLNQVQVKPPEDPIESSDPENLQKLKQDIAAEKRQKEEAILENSKYKNEIDAISEKIDNLADALDMVPSDPQQVLISLKEVIEDYKHLQKTHEQLSKRSSDESQASAREAEEMRGEISDQEKELNVVHETNASLMEQLKTTTAGHSALNETCQSLELDLIQAETDLQILQKEKQILV